MFHNIINPSPKFSIPFSLFLVTLAVNLSMPLFRDYGAVEGFSHGKLALILGAYTIGMLPCYIFLGGISDVVGRKKILIISVCMSLMSDVFITISPTIWTLLICRIFQGVALGLSMGTGTAYLSEYLSQIAQESMPDVKSAHAMSLATSIGFSGGAFFTTIALLMYYSHRPITYFIAIALTVIGLIWTWFLPNLKPIGGSIMRLPYFPKQSIPINIEIAIGWACTSIIIVLIPSQLMALGLGKYSGFGLVFVNWTGALLQTWIKKKFSPIKALKIGTIIAPCGFLIIIIGLYYSQLWLTFLGAATVGSSAYGFSYQGGLAAISMLGASQKARAVSGFMCIGYIGFGLMPILIGFLSDRWGMFKALCFFEFVIIFLSIWLVWYFTTKTSPYFKALQ